MLIILPIGLCIRCIRECTKNEDDEEILHQSNTRNRTRVVRKKRSGGAATVPGGAATVPGGAAAIPGGAATFPGGAAAIPGGAATVPGSNVVVQQPAAQPISNPPQGMHPQPLVCAAGPYDTQLAQATAPPMEAGQAQWIPIMVHPSQLNN